MNEQNVALETANLKSKGKTKMLRSCVVCVILYPSIVICLLYKLCFTSAYHLYCYTVSFSIECREHFVFVFNNFAYMDLFSFELSLGNKDVHF